MRPQFLALRNTGVDVQQMARAAGPPMFLYSNENYGLSDTALHSSRTSVAAAASSATCGKHPDIILYILDGASGKLDPAFDANAGPFKFWALAVWQEWFPTSVLQTALERAKARLDKTRGSVWSPVAGPVTAFVATAARMKWTITDATKATDDVGHASNFAADAPAAIAAAVARSVRRWRLERIFSNLPTIAPPTSDASTSPNTLLADFASTVKCHII